MPRMAPMGQVTGVAVHHSASPRSTTLRTLRRWHVEENGWADVGYHRIILGDGTSVAGRPLHFQGASVRGKNRGLIAILVMGNNASQDPNHHWIGDQWAALRRELDAIALLWGNLPVNGHRDLDPRTECPGVDIRSQLRLP